MLEIYRALVALIERSDARDGPHERLAPLLGPSRVRSRRGNSSSARPSDSETLLGLREEEAAALGPDGTTRIRTFRLVLMCAQELRTLMDERLRPDGLTTQQAALINIVEAMGTPSLSVAASTLGTTHQNAKQLAAALERKGFLRIVPDRVDGRVRRLKTTAKSRRFWKQRSSSDQQRVLEWFADLSQDEASTLFHLLLGLKASVHRHR